jgi:hypothetical protein
MNLDLSDDEREALTRHLRETIDRDRFPLSLRLAPLRAILDKLAPPKPRAPLPEPRPKGDSAKLAAKKRGRVGLASRERHPRFDLLQPTNALWRAARGGRRGHY